MFPTNLTPPEQLRALIKRLPPLTPPALFIRIGLYGGGGYLVPDDLVDVCLLFTRIRSSFSV